MFYEGVFEGISCNLPIEIEFFVFFSPPLTVEQGNPCCPASPFFVVWAALFNACFLIAIPIE